MAEGKVNGSITHNYKNNDVTINLNLNKANAEQIAQSLFKIKGQIFGLANDINNNNISTKITIIEID